MVPRQKKHRNLSCATIPWTEFLLAQWDLRRSIGDFCSDVASLVSTARDFNNIGRQINCKGASDGG